jgi:hypothetical protein
MDRKGKSVEEIKPYRKIYTHFESNKNIKNILQVPGEVSYFKLYMYYTVHPSYLPIIHEM